MLYQRFGTSHRSICTVRNDYIVMYSNFIDSFSIFSFFQQLLLRDQSESLRNGLRTGQDFNSHKFILIVLVGAYVVWTSHMDRWSTSCKGVWSQVMNMFCNSPFHALSKAWNHLEHSTHIYEADPMLYFHQCGRYPDEISEWIVARFESSGANR